MNDIYLKKNKSVQKKKIIYPKDNKELKSNHRKN